MQKKKLHLPAIQALKGWGILAVLFVHAQSVTGYTDLSWYTQFVYLFGTGASAFFILSGLTLFLSFSRKKDFSFWTYLWRRFVRISLLYFPVLVFAFWLTQSRLTFFERLSYFAYLNNLIPSLHMKGPLNGPEWFAATIMLFYLIVPYLYQQVKTINHALFWFVSLFFTLNTVELIWFFSLTQAEFTPLYRYFYNNIFHQIIYFLAGIYIFFPLFKQVKIPKWHAIIWSGVGSYALVVALIINQSLYSRFQFLVLFWIIFIYFLISHPKHLLNNFIIRFLGSISYPIFLVHNLVVFYFKDTFHFWLDTWPIRDQIVGFFIFLFVSAITIFISYWLYLLERRLWKELIQHKLVSS